VTPARNRGFGAFVPDADGRNVEAVRRARVTDAINLEPAR
jgi:hypothetical protein